ncbi:SGNH/GDSL hydrolase family protein [Methylobacterium oryzisoli]|uniref:SGNH/GDSL hydrolase family protein n=1 Tax=Methylobacterium oryzisoli TaxID=3385502 RepID=UPI0038927998
MSHIVLLGDSVFDNGAYVRGGPDVVRQVRTALPEGARATLLAVDGAVLADVTRQLARLPDDATHLVVSAGGNDALRASGLLDGRAASIAEAIAALADVRDRFRAEYRAMLDAVLARGRSTAICTIYDPRYPDPARRRLASAALTLLNDAITREAFARDLALIDLRVLCDEDADFANPIEPSVRGGEKIAGAVAALLQAPSPRSRVLARP